MRTTCLPIYIFDSLYCPSLAVQDNDSNPFVLVLVRMILVVIALLLLVYYQPAKFEKRAEVEEKW